MVLAPGPIVKDAAIQAIADYQVENWWHAARRQLLQRLLDEGLATGRNTALDLGCGPGSILPLLRTSGFHTVIGLDRSEKTLHLVQASQPDVALTCSDAAVLPIADESVDAVTILGVLCHSWIHDERAVLSEVMRILRPGGVLCVTEPAFPSLTRAADRLVMSVRRYSPGEMTGIAESCGLRCLRDGHFAAWAFPAAWMLARVDKWRNSREAEELPLDLRPLPQFLNRVLYGISRLEVAAIRRGIRFPFGVTFFGLYRKPI